MITVIGLTGPSGSGKTAFCSLAGEFGIRSIDTDKVYHSLLIPPSPCLDELHAAFGSKIILSDGTLDRKRLASIVFDDRDKEKQKLSLLNSITHKYVLDRTEEMIADAEKDGARAVIVDAPALYESGFDKKCDFVVCLLADVNLRIDRITARDGITKDHAIMRIKGQKNDEFYSARADFTVINNGILENMRSDIQKILSYKGLL